jgi:hypothetical protein
LGLILQQITAKATKGEQICIKIVIFDNFQPIFCVYVCAETIKPPKIDFSIPKMSKTLKIEPILPKI